MILDPYNMNPLSALVIFNTPTALDVMVTVGDIAYTRRVDAGRAEVPIIALYPGTDNIVTFSTGDESVTVIERGAFECDRLTSVTFEGLITSGNFAGFPGDLRDKYLARDGGPGTYTRFAGGAVRNIPKRYGLPLIMLLCTKVAAPYTLIKTTTIKPLPMLIRRYS